MCQRQSSACMLPSAAEMPPCAATVCERVGNTLVRQAVFRPACARPTTARSPAPPAPTTTTSYLCSVIAYAVLTRSTPQRNLENRENARSRRDRVRELQHQQRD